MRVVLADDHRLFREGLSALLTASGVEVVGEAGTGVEAIEAARDLRPDVLLMDLDMPEMGGLEATRLIKIEMPDLPIMILTASARELNLFEAVKSGAQGYVLKTTSPDQLVAQIRAAARGEVALDGELGSKILAEFTRLSEEFRAPRQRVQPALNSESRAANDVPIEEISPLSAREREVLEHLMRGKTNREIADELIVSENTVKYHLKNILTKLHVSNRAQVVAWAMHRGFGARPAALDREGS